MSYLPGLHNLIILWSICALSICAQNASTSEIIPLLRNGRLVPNILPEFTPTIGPLTITYPQGIVNYGNALNLSVVTYAPLIQFSGETDFPDATYTLLMVDPDAPSPQAPTSAFIRHWLVSNVSPSSEAQNYSNGNVLSSYRSPAPPLGSAAHRYVTLLLRQDANVNVSIFNQTAVQMFNVSSFVQQNSLTYVSANYFNATRTNSSSPTASGTSGGNGGSSAPTAGSGASSLDSRSAPALAWSLLTIFVLCVMV